MVMINNKWIIFAVFPAIIFTLVSFITYANTTYGPAPTPVVYRTYVITMNLTDSRPTAQFLNSIVNEYPLTYREDSLITNTTPVWVTTANREFTLYIVNASETTIQQEVMLNSTALTNDTGGITWTLEVPLYLIYPQPVYANWYVIITEDKNGAEYVVFAFETGNESLTQILSELSTVGGYLIALNGESYHLWNYYYGYNPVTGGISEHYEVGLPGLSLFTMWVGQGINASSWPSSGFQEALQVLSYSFNEYVNSSLITHLTLSPNVTISEITNYGYTVYQRPRLVPFGPVIYISPILLLPNGTIINPACLSGTYYLLQVNYVTQSGYSIPVYETKNYPMGLYLLNGSLLFGGYLQAYDLFNESIIPITPEQYLSPIYQSQVSEVSWCALRVINNEIITQMNSIMSDINVSAISVNSVITDANSQYEIHQYSKSSYIINRINMELRLRT